MFLRRRRQTSQRFGILTAGVVAYLLSFAPIAGTVIYCISDDGHAGFEVVAQTERGCASCCHEAMDATGAGGVEAAAAECTDIALSSPELISSSSTTGPAAVLPPDAFVHAVAITPPARDFRPTGEQTALAPPRSTASALVRHTVLLI